ncbi:hypothetical protein E2C01_086297 [Portunus trituberculatus]|uniref:Uncharacterized protein n=1 Tax=Portunus trituberculatus TaxID=210409 RepID=A0A5B7J9X4_PORTR|nr:hypothetical protein [Portunus trituberculatus]
MAKTEPLHLMRCMARAAEPGLGPCRLRLSVIQHRGFPLFSTKKRVLADLVFAKHSWERHATGEWRNKTPCTLVRLCTLRKVKAVLPVQVKVWTMQGAVIYTFLHLRLEGLMYCLQSCTTPLTLDVTCSSVGVAVTCPGEGTAVAQLPAHLANTTPTEGAASGNSSLQGETDSQGPLEEVAETTSFLCAHQPVFTEKSKMTPPHCQDDEESRPSGPRPLRFSDSGSMFVQLLKEYETHDLKAGEANTHKEKEEEDREWRTLMWLNCAAVQILPLCFIGFFLVNLHRDFIPLVYGTWAFPV